MGFIRDHKQSLKAKFPTNHSKETTPDRILRAVSVEMRSVTLQVCEDAC